MLDFLFEVASGALAGFAAYLFATGDTGAAAVMLGVSVSLILRLIVDVARETKH